MNISLSPEIIFNIGSFPISNTMLWGFVLSVILIVYFVYVARKMKNIPGPLQNFTEVLIDGGYDFVENVLGDKRKAKKAFPLVFSIFIFVAVANLATYIPGQSAISIAKEEGSIPLFRAIMSDYSFVFMLTLLSVIVAQVVAIAVNGPFGYLGKYINLSGIKDFFKYLFKGEVRFGVFFQGLLDLFLGLMDLVGEVAKIVSLSFRLFGNMFAGEVITAVILFLAPFFLPLPFMILGLLTAIVQAFVFAVLTLIYIAMASEIEEEELTEKTVS